MSRAGRRVAGVLGLAAALAVAAMAALHLHHRRLLGFGELESAADALASRSWALRAAAATFEPQAALAALGPNPKSGPHFRFDEHLAEARLSPPHLEAPPARARRLGFEFDGADPVPLVPARAAPALEGGVLRLDHAHDDYLITRGAFDTGSDPLAEIEIRIRLAQGRRFTLGWSRRRLGAWPENEVWVDTLEVDVVTDGAFHVYRVNAEHALRLRPGKRIRTFFLVPSDAEGDRVEIDYVRFVRKRERFADPPVGRAWETLAGELRPVLYTDTPRELSFEVPVPEADPHLALGMGILEEGKPVRFSVSVEDGDAPVELLSRRVASRAGWHDARLDLGPWAGRRVVVRLGAESEGDGVGLWSSPRLSGAPREPLNVLLIVEDALRADRLSAWGHPRETSPAKDRLADRYLTLAEILRSQGWETASFVQNLNAGAAAGLHQGFSQLFPQTLMGTRPEGIYGERVLRWIAEHRDRNFFVYLHVLDPHGTYDPPPPFDAFYREEGPGGSPAPPDRQLLDPAWVTEPTVEGRRLLYDGEIRHNDARFEAFLEELARLGVLEQTLVVFLSDHGEHLGERELWEHHPPGFAQVLRVPLLMSHPRLLPQGLRITGPVQLLDLVPTVLALAGVKTDPLLLQGDSLLPLVRGEDRERWSRRLAVSEEAIAYKRHRPERVRASFFFGRWHLLRTRHAGHKSVWIFDYASDPQEERPLGTRRLDPLLGRRTIALLRELKRANLGIFEEMTRGAPESIRLDPDAQEQLRALGYID
jgi:hypothetical protein